MNHAELLSAVQDLLPETSIKFGDIQELDSQFTVLRVSVLEGLDTDSIIIKQIPEDARFGADKRFRSEMTGLEFANLIATDTPFAPKMIAGDVEQRLIVIEDLGDIPTLDDCLHDSSTDGIALLKQYGTFLGKMHAASIGREAEFRAIQQRLDTEAPLSDSSIDLREHIDKLEAAFAPNPHMSEKFTTELVALCEAIDDSPIYRAFCHCDAGAHNVLVTDDRVRFVDFEFSTYCNPLMDMLPVYTAFPTFWNGHPIPRKSIKVYENAYREELSTAMPEISDDDSFFLLLEQCSAKWVLGKFASMAEQLYPLFVRNETGDMDEEQVAFLVKKRNFAMKLLKEHLNYFDENPRLPVIYAALKSLYEETAQHNDNIVSVEPYEAF